MTLRLAIGISMLALMATQASAANLNLTIDLTKPDSPGVYRYQGLSPVNAPITISEGDRFTLNFDFKDDQTLTLVNPTSVAVGVTDRYLYQDTYGSGSLSFLDAQGNPFLTSSDLSYNNVQFVGGTFTSSYFPGGLPDTITVSGIRYSGAVDDYDDLGYDKISHRFANSIFAYSAAGASTGASAPGAPSPVLGLGWFSAIAGAGALIATRRRRPSLLAG